jgi:hypothetical protein
VTTTQAATPDAATPEVRMPEVKSRARLVVAAIALSIAAGLVLRFAIKSDLWLDEALSVNIAHLPVSQIPSWLKHDGAPPLYYVLLHYWMRVFGTSDVAVRALSGVFSVASLPLAWQCGKRIGGRATAWIAVLVLSASPYAVVYATTTRMYSIEIFLVFAGILVVRRAFERPTFDRVALLAVLTAILVYTQYWGLYLVIAVGLFLLGTALRVPQHRDAAVRLLIALAIGAATFAAWLPTFFYQAKHTGTPWGQALLPPTPIGLTFQDFSGGNQHEGWILLFVLFALLLVGVFGVAVDRRHIDLDLHTQPNVRWEAAVGAAALLIGTTLAWAGRSAFQSRYASIVFPFFVLLVARGVTCFADPRVRNSIIAIVVVVGFVGGVRNAATNRTEAGEVAAILRADAKPGDIVLYCPDQVAPAVHRLVQPGLDEMTYPLLHKPELVDWVDYTKVIAQHPPVTVAHEVLALAGHRTIWYVSAPGYRTHTAICEPLATDLAQARPDRVRLAPNSKFFELPGLQEFPAS